jgi:DNA-directed RNA polymerase specialized sigma24 family protein
MKLPEKQAKRIYARYYLCMTVNEIAAVEGVDPSRVRDSIRRGLKKLEKTLTKVQLRAPVFTEFCHC